MLLFFKLFLTEIFLQDRRSNQTLYHRINKTSISHILHPLERKTILNPLPGRFLLRTFRECILLLDRKLLHGNLAFVSEIVAFVVEQGFFLRGETDYVGGDYFFGEGEVGVHAITVAYVFKGFFVPEVGLDELGFVWGLDDEETRIYRTSA